MDSSSMTHTAGGYDPTGNPFAPNGYGPGTEGEATTSPVESKADMTSISDLTDGVQAAAIEWCGKGLAAGHFDYLTGEGVDPSFLRRMAGRSHVFTGECMGRRGIFFLWDDGRADTDVYAQFRADEPGTFANGDAFPKYVGEKGREMPLWLVKRGTPGGPIDVQEGTKQALVSAGYAPRDTWVYAVAGCANWNVRSLQSLDATGRDVTVTLDADMGTNWNVWNQAARMKEALTAYLDTRVKFAPVPLVDSDKATGLDDYLKQFPADQRASMRAGVKAKASATLPREPKKKKPDNDGYTFPEALTALLSDQDGADKYSLPAGAAHSTDGGLWVDRGKFDARATFGPVIITRTFRDHLNVSSVELAWLVRGKPVSATVPRGMLTNGRALLETLGDRGFPAVTSDAASLETYLAGLLIANEPLIADQYLARWLGWQPDGGFVATADDGVMVELPEAKMQQRVPAYTTGGTFDGWKAAVKGIESRSVPRIALAASFAANLLKPLGYNSFTVALDGRSSGGKTISATGAASVWHDPAPSSAAHMNWDTTPMGIELRMGVAHGMLTWLDETQLVPERQAAKVGGTVYALPDDHGRSRGGAWLSQVSWSGVLLATGEKDLLSFVKGQGAAARVVQMHGRPFGDDGAASARQADAYRDGTSANYGHAGPSFAGRLSAELAGQGARDRLRARAAELAKHFKGENDIANRRADRIGVLMLAEELACTWGILPYAPLTADQWLGAINTAEATDDRPRMAMDALSAFLAANPGRVSATDGKGVNVPNGGWSAFIKRDRVAAREFYALSPESLAGILEDAGYDLHQVEAEWIGRGWLRQMKDSEGRPVVRVGKSRFRAVCVWSDVIEGDGSDDGTEAPQGVTAGKSGADGPAWSTPSGVTAPVAEPEQPKAAPSSGFTNPFLKP